MTFDLGPVGSSLGIGPHVARDRGFERRIDSTDFIVSADLSLAGLEVVPDQEGWFTMVATNSVLLSGMNTVPNSPRCSSTDGPAAYNLPAASGRRYGTWSRE